MRLFNAAPSYVGSFLPRSYGTHVTRSDAGIEDVVTTACEGYGFSFKIRWEGLSVAQSSQLIRWWDTVQLDSRARISTETFFIPPGHPIWRNVLVKSAIQRFQLVEEDLVKAQWRAFEFSNLDNPESCALFSWETSVVEVPGVHEYFF